MYGTGVRETAQTIARYGVIMKTLPPSSHLPYLPTYLQIAQEYLQHTALLLHTGPPASSSSSSIDKSGAAYIPVMKGLKVLERLVMMVCR